MKANAIIKAALRKVGALSRGFSPSDEEMQEGLDELNTMLAGWTNDDLLIPYRTTESIALTVGTHTYTWAASGGTGSFTTARPLSILDAYLTDSSNTTYEIRQITKEQWNRITYKANQYRPEYFAYECRDTTGLLWFERQPESAYTFNVDSLKEVTDFTTLTTEDSFPARYLDAIRLNLAVRLAPEREGEDANVSLITEADDALAAIKSKNDSQRLPVLRLDSFLTPRTPFDIESGTY